MLDQTDTRLMLYTYSDVEPGVLQKRKLGLNKKSVYYTVTEKDISILKCFFLYPMTSQKLTLPLTRHTARYISLWSVWRNVRTFARDPKGRGFESRPVRFQVTALGKLLMHMCICQQAV